LWDNVGVINHFILNWSSLSPGIAISIETFLFLDKELESNIAILASEFTLIQTILTDLLEYFTPSPYIKLVKA